MVWLISFSHFLEEELAKFEPAENIKERALRILGGVENQLAVAAERFEHFFAHKQAGQL